MNKIMFNMTKKSNTHSVGSTLAGACFFQSCMGVRFFKLAIKFFSGHCCFTAESRYCKVIQEWNPTKLWTIVRCYRWATNSQLDLILIDEASADRLFRLVKKDGTIQYGYRTWGTHARVFSQTLPHGISKNDLRQRNRRRW